LVFAQAKTFIWAGILNGLAILVPFGLGVLLGIFIISKIIEYLFLNFPSLTNSGILGLVIASPIAILTNTGAFADLTQTGSVGYALIAIALLLASFYITYKLSLKEDPQAPGEMK
jgi:putative membrane protein